MKKVLCIVLLTLFITGCGSKEIDYKLKNEENFYLKLQISGKIDGEEIEDRITISKYNDSQSIYRNKNEEIYIFNEKFYKDRYKEKEIKDIDLRYKNLELILKSYQKPKKILEKDTYLLENNEVDFIKFELSKKAFNSILNSINVEYKFNTNATGYVYKN